ncbi:tetratricopeptide repeat protein [Agrilactobacillus yilanensis]|uniref:Tetratricopeptide repeat protein n=1 Tax=Agrilactobacillus yilanensis TaxID=2485997 RepID=A0ABW4J9K5_9LACO|nr:tetratricopeptide repeat protein [Agrilactobacillus yilanensis]
MSYSEQMLQMLEDGDLKQADALFTRALHSDDDDTLYSLAEELYALGFVQQAKKVYLQLLKAYPQEDALKTVLADIAIGEGKSDTALNYLETIQNTSSAYGQALLTAADVYQTLGLPEVSEAKLKEAERLYSDEPVIWFALGELYFSLGRYAEAVAQYQKLLDEDETEFAGVLILQRMGASLAGMGAYEEAVAALEQLPQEALDKDTNFQLGFLYLQLKDYDQAIDVLQHLEQADPNYTSLYAYLAEAQEQNGDLNGAFATVQMGIGYDEFNEVLYQKAFDLATKLGDETAAQQYLEQLLKINPDNQGTVLALSNLYLKQRRYEATVQLLTDYGQNGKDPQMLWNLAQAQAALEDYDSAKENYLLAYNSLKTEPNFLRDLINFFQEMGLVKEEIVALKNYVKLEPTDFERQELLDTLLDEEQL